MRAIQDRYGFLFWLRWILVFAGSFIAAAIFWTTLMQKLFGPIEGPERTISWVIAVFGTWFLLAIPFMRKKEQIWKRLNVDQERAVDAWFTAMAIFIGLLVASSFGWSFVFTGRAWMKAVFGSWLVILVPFLIWMYRKADTIFKSAASRQLYTPNYQSLLIDREKRVLPINVQDQLKKMPATLNRAHLVNLKLRDGRVIPKAFIINGQELVGLYDQTTLDFSTLEVEAVEAVSDPGAALDETKWLRFDAPEAS